MFNPRNLIAGGLAVVVVLGAWFGLRSLFSEDAEQPPAPAVAEPEPAAEAPPEEPEAVEEEVEEPDAPQLEVLAAKRRIQAGEMLLRDALEWRQWREPTDAEFALVKNTDGSFLGLGGGEEASMNDVLGTVAGQPIEAGTPIFWSDIIAPNAPGFLTAVLAPGHRAVTINVAGAAANAGIIHPGDRVDVILIYSQGQGGQALAALGPVAQVIASDVRVLAIGSTVLRMRPQGRPDLAGDPAPGGGAFTLEVPPADAERISLAAATGQLDLALRSVLPSADGEPQDGRLVDLDDVMRPPAVPPGVEAARVRIIRGNRGASEELVLIPERLSEQVAGS